MVLYTKTLCLFWMHNHFLLWKTFLQYAYCWMDLSYICTYRPNFRPFTKRTKITFLTNFDKFFSLWLKMTFLKFWVFRDGLYCIFKFPFSEKTGLKFYMLLILKPMKRKFKTYYIYCGNFQWEGNIFYNILIL